MQAKKHNNIWMKACPTHKHDAMRETKNRYKSNSKHHKEKQENKHNVKQTE